MIKANTSKNKYLYFNNFTTSELKSLITSDFYSENASLDSDELYIILQILEEREKNTDNNNKYNVQDCWKSFIDNYLPLSKRKISLYETSISFGKYNVPHSKRLIILIALIIFAFTISTTGVAKELIKIFPNWTEEYFWFSEDVTALDKVAIQESFNISSLPEHIAPTWLPPDLVLIDKSLIENSSFQEIHLHYNNPTNTEYLNLSILYLKTDVASYYEKDETPVEIYSKNNIDFYIMKNIDDIVVLWRVDNFECELSGTIDYDDFIKIINSI